MNVGIKAVNVWNICVSVKGIIMKGKSCESNMIGSEWHDNLVYKSQKKKGCKAKLCEKAESNETNEIVPAVKKSWRGKVSEY